MSRDSPLSRSRIHAGGSAGWKIPGGGKFRQRVASLPERFGCLTSAQLAAVPHDCRPRLALRRFRRESCHLLSAPFGQRTARIHLGADRLAVMDQE